MPYIHSSRGKAFRLTFLCITLKTGDGKAVRAAIIGVGKTPDNDPNFMTAVVAYEEGAIMPRVIRREDYIKAQADNDYITLVEAPDTVGHAVLCGPDGKAITREDA